LNEKEKNVSISSLTKFTVPLPNNQSASTQGLLMPKLKFRFRVTFEGFGISSQKTELTKQVKDFKRPNPTWENIVLDVYNSKVNILGKPSWAEVTCNLRDDASGNVSKLVGEQIQKQFDFMEQSSAASGIDYKFVTRLEVLDGGNGGFTPNVLETWEMYGCMLTGVDYGDNNYGTNEETTIALTMRFDNALQKADGSGVGTNVGRTIGTNTN
jgi:hypothetical protein